MSSTPSTSLDADSHSGECHAEVVRITAVNPHSDEPAGEDAYGVVAWGAEADVILRCAPSLEMLRAVVGDITDTEALYDLAYALDPHIGPPWDTDADDDRESRLAQLSARYEPHREMLMRYVDEGYAAQPSALVVRIVTLDADTGAATDVWFGVWARGPYATAITRSASSLAELAELADASLDDEQALWQLAQRGARHIGTFEGHVVNPLLAPFGFES